MAQKKLLLKAKIPLQSGIALSHKTMEGILPDDKQ
jgi:hypothetical protein